MADITKVAKNVRVVNTQGLITRVRPTAEAIDVGESVYLDANSKWALADGSAAGTLPCCGIVIGLPDGRTTGVAGDDAEVCMQGFLGGFDVTAGKILYQSDTAGALADAAGTVSQKVALAMDNDVIYVNPAL